MKEFYSIISEGCEGNSFRDILDNLTDEQILESVNEYAAQFAHGDNWYQLSKREFEFLRGCNDVSQLHIKLKYRLIKLGAVANIKEFDTISKFDLLVKYNIAKKKNIEFKKMLIK